jgi:cytochrome subunit of sulfide dehydrogenase
MKRSRACGLVAIALASAPVAIAQQPTPLFAPPNLTKSGVRDMAAACAMCHGVEGRPVAGSVVAALAGQRAADIDGAMHAFKEGRREATVMHQIAKGYDDAEIAALAEYFAARPR